MGTVKRSLPRVLVHHVNANKFTYRNMYIYDIYRVRQEKKYPLKIFKQYFPNY